VEAIKKFFLKDQFAAHCGIELLEVSPGWARSKMALQPCHMNGLGCTQGGAIFTLADLTFAAASNSHGTAAVAINVNISYLKATQTGVLWAEARELSKNPKLGTYTVEVKDDAGDLVALFQGMVYRKDVPLKAD